MITKYDCTRKVERFRKYMTDQEICEKIGISRNTLYKRIKDSSTWKKSEIYLVEAWTL